MLSIRNLKVHKKHHKKLLILFLFESINHFLGLYKKNCMHVQCSNTSVSLLKLPVTCINFYLNKQMRDKSSLKIPLWLKLND